MPKIYEYLGIVLYFYSDEHNPVHVHARYNGAEIKVSFFIKDGKIYRTTYTPVKGKFSTQKLKALKRLIKAYNYNIINKWTNYFTLKIQPDFCKVTIKL